MEASGEQGHELSVIYSLMKMMLDKEKKRLINKKLLLINGMSELMKH